MKRYMLVLSLALLCAACSKKSPTAPPPAPDTTPRILSCTFTDSIYLYWDRWQVGGVWDSSRSFILKVNVRPVFSYFAGVDSASDSTNCSAVLDNDSVLVFVGHSYRPYRIVLNNTPSTGLTTLDEWIIEGAPGPQLDLSDSVRSVKCLWCEFSWWSHGVRYTNEVVLLGQ